jgi:hypothetical protein
MAQTAPALAAAKDLGAPLSRGEVTDIVRPDQLLFGDGGNSSSIEKNRGFLGILRNCLLLQNILDFFLQRGD